MAGVIGPNHQREGLLLQIRAEGYIWYTDDPFSVSWYPFAKCDGKWASTITQTRRYMMIRSSNT